MVGSNHSPSCCSGMLRSRFRAPPGVKAPSDGTAPSVTWNPLFFSLASWAAFASGRVMRRQESSVGQVPFS